jgi:hypothetical protein
VKVNDWSNLPEQIKNDSIIPASFRHLGFPMWWAIIEAYLFRFQPKVEAYILQKAQLMGNCSGFPFGSPVAGLHVRHGDKHIDGFKEHSYFEEVSSLQRSPDCVSYRDGRCYGSDGRELKVYVASDDGKVLKDATMNGHLTTPIDAGVSQSTGTTGMAVTLRGNPSLGYNASLEILSDIFFLSHCSTLVGMAGSQIFRISVAISNATGLLRYAAAMDHDQIPRTIALSNKWDVIFVESFKNAKSNRI